MKYIAYYRVSTKKQEETHLGLDAQRDTVLKYIKNNGNVLIAEFTEIESGKKDRRPQLSKAIDLCKAEGATLVVAKLDRLYRDVYFTAKLMKDKIKFVCCDMPEASDFTIHILAAVAQKEREYISIRTMDALAAKKRNEPTWRPGNPNLTPERRKLGHAAVSFKARNDESIRKAYHFIALLVSQGVPMNQIARRLNEENYRTVTGKLFHLSQVRNIWRRFQKEEQI